MINLAEHNLDYLIGIMIFKDTDTDTCYLHEKGSSYCRPIGFSDTDMFLNNLYYKMYGKPMSDKALDKLNCLLIFLAKNEDVEYRVYRRAAQIGNKVYVDMGNKSIARITPKSVSIVNKAPVKFAISNAITKIAMPDLDYPNLDLLKNYIKANQDQLKLIIVFIINCYLTNSHYVGLVLIGEPGSGKSFASKVLKTIIDNSNIKLRNQMDKTEDLIIASQQSHLLVINNASIFKAAVQDGMCTVLTSGTFARRTFFKNKSESFMQTHSPVIINGVKNPLTQSDAIDRCIIIHLSRISDSEDGVISELKLEQNFENDLPQIVGGVFDLLSKVLDRLTDFEPQQKLSRMADFHTLGLACEEVLNWKKGTFNRIYKSNKALGQLDALEDSPIAEAIVIMKDRNLLPFDGTYSELNSKLVKLNNIGNVKARKLSSDLDYLASPLLNIHGIKITNLKRCNKGSRLRIELV